MDFLLTFLNSLPGAFGQGLAWGIMAIGVYITFRILDIADLTVTAPWPPAAQWPPCASAWSGTPGWLC